MAAIFASVYMLSVIYPGSLSCTSEYKSGFGLIPMPTNLGMRLKFTHGHICMVCNELGAYKIYCE